MPTGWPRMSCRRPRSFKLGRVRAYLSHCPSAKGRYYVRTYSDGGFAVRLGNWFVDVYLR